MYYKSNIFFISLVCILFFFGFFNIIYSENNIYINKDFNSHHNNNEQYSDVINSTDHYYPSCLSSYTLFDQIFAVVGSYPVTKYDFYIENINAKLDNYSVNNYIPEVTFSNHLHYDLLNNIINKICLLNKARDYDLVVSDNELDYAISKVIGCNNLSLDLLCKILKSLGLNFDTYVNNIMKDQILIYKLKQHLIAGRYCVSNYNISEYIDKNFIQKDILYKVQNIFIPFSNNSNFNDKERLLYEANFIYRAIKSGLLSFESASKQYSHSINAANGGYLNWSYLSELPKDYYCIVKQMCKFEVSLPFFNEYGVHILYLVDMKCLDNIKRFEEQYILRNVIVEFNSIFTEDQAYKKILSIIYNLKNINATIKLDKSFLKDYISEQQIYDTDWIALSQMPLAISNQVKLIGLNKISNPIKFENYWQIFELIDYRKIDITQKYQEEDAIYSLSMEKEQEILINQMTDILKNTYIKVFNQP